MSDDEDDHGRSLLRGGEQRAALSDPRPVTQCGPSASWPVVLVPMGGPRMTVPVLTMSVAARDRHGEAVEAARRRATLLLTDPVVLRAVARALEPLRRDAGRHAAAEVHALLVERDEPGLHAGEHRRRSTPSWPWRGRPAGYCGDPHAALGEVEEAAARLRSGELMSSMLADVDLGAEAAAELGPQEGEHRRPRSR